MLWYKTKAKYIYNNLANIRIVYHALIYIIPKKFPIGVKNYIKIFLEIGILQADFLFCNKKAGD